MKKLVIILTIVAVFFSFASCGSAPVQDKTEPDSVQEDANSTVAQTAPAAADSSAAVEGSSVQPVYPTESSAPASNGSLASADTASVQNGSVQQSTTADMSQPTVVSPAESAQTQASVVSEPVTVEGGNYTVDIISAGTDTDYTGAQVIVVKFKFTNNGSESACFGDVALVDVRQGGRSLNGESVIMDSNSFEGLSFNFRAPVNNGGSITCVYAYPYNSSDDIDVSVSILSNDNARATLGKGSATLSVG